EFCAGVCAAIPARPTGSKRNGRPSRRSPRTSQTITLPSLEPVYSVAPSRLKSGPSAAPACPVKRSRRALVGTSQRLTLPSSEVVASTLPSVLNASASTRPVARRCMGRSVPVRRSTRTMLPSSWPMAAVSATRERVAAPEPGEALAHGSRRYVPEADAAVIRGRREHLAVGAEREREHTAGCAPVHGPQRAGAEVDENDAAVVLAEGGGVGNTREGRRA